MINTLIASTLVGAALLATPSIAQPAPFSFRSVEFMPSEQRLPAAQQFVSRAARPGTPLALAQDRLMRAGARCRSAKDFAGVGCEYTTMEHRPGDPQRDIAWQVRLMTDGGGRLSAASVERKVYGV